jgi:hypothetical protein
MRIKLIGAAIAMGLAFSLGPTLAGGGWDARHVEVVPEFKRNTIGGPRRGRKTKTAAQLKREAIKRRNIEKRI